jgi:sugar lactone lactonase YvrE
MNRPQLWCPRRRNRLLTVLFLLLALALPARALATPGDPIVLTDDALSPGKFFKALDRVRADGSPEQLTAAEALRVGSGLAFSGPETAVVVGLQSVSRFDFSTHQVTTVPAPTAGDMRGVALAPDGSLLATDLGPSGGTAADGRVVRIDPATGAATAVASGNTLVNPLGIAVAEDGTAYVTNSDGAGHGDVVKVDPASGDQEVLPANPNPLVAPWGIAFLPNGELVLADESYNHAFRGALVRIDPATGRQTPLLLEHLSGPIDGATAVAVDAAGEVLVTERGSNQVDRVNLQSAAAQQIGQGIASPIGIETEPGIAPTTRLIGGPSGTTRSTTPSFSFEPSLYGSQSSCEVDGGPVVPCRRAYTTEPLANGPHSFIVSSSRFGFAGPTAVRNFTVDPAAPDTLIDSGPSGLTADSTPTFTFEAPGGGTSFTCALDGGAQTLCVSPFTTGVLADGPHTFNVRAEGDPVGDTRSFTVDTTPPQTSIASGPAEGAATNNTQPTFIFASSEDPATFSCTLDGAPVFCDAVFEPPTPLIEGPHVLTVAARDAAGNQDTPLMRHFTVDTTPPETTITAGPSGPTGNATPTFEFTASEPGAFFSCSIDSTTLASCSSPFTPSPALADGPHVFRVRATDAAGNLEPTVRERAFTVDALVPETSITAGPSGLTNDPTPSFEFTSTKHGSSFACSLDGAPPVACQSPLTTDTLAEGPHTFAVVATDAQGNADPTPASRDFTVDTTPPQTVLDSGPGPLTSDRTPRFEFSSEPGATFACSLDGAPAAPCASPFTAPPLADGAHTLEIAATDAAGNVEAPALRSAFTVDTVAPETTITAGPSGPTGDAAPSFEFTASEPGVTFRCSIGDGVLAPCSSPFTVSPALADGPHAFRVQATDAAGNVETVVRQRDFVVDTTVPDTAITAGPNGPTNDPTPSFELTSTKPGSTFACSLDGAAPVACQSPLTTGALADGPHTLTVLATDALGHQDPTAARRDFAVDTVAPETRIDAGPGAETTDRRPSFSLSASEAATFTCRLDGAPAAPCGPSFQPAGQLAFGDHSLVVTALDLAGNADATPATRSFRVIEAPHAPPAPETHPPLPTQLRLRTVLHGRKLGLQVLLSPPGTGTVALTVRGHAGRRPLIRHLSVTLSGGAGSATLRLPQGVSRVRITAAYGGDSSHAAASTTTTRSSAARQASRPSV